jgi:hypothetical protein
MTVARSFGGWPARPVARTLTAATAALVALALVAGPVAATEHYRNAAALRLTGTTTRYGSAYLDRYFGGSPVGPIKTTIRVKAANMDASARHSVRIWAGECESEGTPLVSVIMASTASGAIDRTVSLTATQRRKVQQAYDRGWPLILTVAHGDIFLCGKLGSPKLVP